MQLSVEDKAYLWDLKVAANDIVDFTRGRNYESYLSDKVTRYAVERQLLVVGEVVKRLSTDFKDSQPTIHWYAMIGLRTLLLTSTAKSSLSESGELPLRMFLHC